MNTLSDFNKLAKRIPSVILTLINYFRTIIAKSPTGVSFISIQRYENRYGEISANLINVGASYAKAKAKDITFLEKLDVTTIKDAKVDSVLLEQARLELIKSFKNPSKSRSQGQKDSYFHLLNGLKVHVETGEVYIYGYREHKKVIVEGEYPTVNSRPLTIAKNTLRKQLRTGKFTQYKLSNIGKLKIDGDTLIIL
jgi:hypothetical protein